MNLRQNLQDIISPLDESAPGLPWQKTNQADAYKAPQPDFENVLRDVLSPDDSTNTSDDNAPSYRPNHPGATPGKPSGTPSQEQDALPPQLTRNMVDFEQRLAQNPGNPMVFNYNERAAGGTFRTELARTAYTNALLGRMG
ncbi:MAG: hypothetical protein HQL95_02705 [Magnetococcales bacterium]|nr:hypothetical protein [Magnetococcales bacterium]